MAVMWTLVLCMPVENVGSSPRARKKEHLFDIGGLGAVEGESTTFRCLGRDRCLRILRVLRTQNGYDGSGIHLILQNILAPTC